MKNTLIKGEYGELPFGIIQEADILTSKEFADLKELAPELKETFLKTQMFRTRTEMEVSVLNDLKHPTPSSKYWQSVREQNVMFQELVFLSYEYRKNLVEIKITQREADAETDLLKKELLQIEAEKKTFIARTQERTAKARIREIKEWSEIKAREASKMTKAELAEVDNHQKISYTKRWIQQLNAMGTSGSPSERHNLLGQLYSGVQVCKKDGLWDEVIKGLPKELVSNLQAQSLLN